MARRIEIWPTDRLVPYAKNARTHSPEQVAQIAASIVEFGFVNPILVDSMDGIIAGHGRLLAARKLGLAEVPVVVLDHLSETQRRAYIIADNKLALNAGWDDELLAELHESLGAEGFDLSLVGFSDEDLDATPGRRRTGGAAGRRGRSSSRTARASGYPARRRVADRTAPADLWRLPGRRCRRAVDGRRQCERGITSPPYATQREYDPSSGFKPIPPDEYVDWYPRRGGELAAVLAPDGSYFLNIKEHADEGERNLYVKDLVHRAPAPVGLAVRG